MSTIHYPTGPGYTPITAMSTPAVTHETNAFHSASILEVQTTATVLSTGSVVLVHAHNKPLGPKTNPTHTYALTTDAHNA